MANLKEYMNEEMPISRWKILSVAVAGAFCGALLATIYMLGAVTVP